MTPDLDRPALQTWLRRALWFAALWIMGVALLLAVATIIRAALA